MNEVIRKMTVMFNNGTPLEEIVAFHQAHGQEVVDAIIEAESTPEGKAAFTAELNALIKETREAAGLPPSVSVRSQWDPCA
jgi:hypothetical protein